MVVSRVAIAIARDHAPINVMSVWRTMPDSLRWLLASDVCIRTCEGLVDVFLVLYAINVVGLDAPQYGGLVAVQMVTSILSYLPSAPLADRIGRTPFVVATFVAFALFPLAVVMSGSFLTLCGAFIIGGLRELGEPARKALIVDLAPPAVRARTIGLYYLIRSLSIAPAAYVPLGGVAPVALLPRERDRRSRRRGLRGHRRRGGRRLTDLRMRVPAREEAGMPHSSHRRLLLECSYFAGDSTIFVATISPWFFL